MIRHATTVSARNLIPLLNSGERLQLGDIARYVLSGIAEETTLEMLMAASAIWDEQVMFVQNLLRLPITNLKTRVSQKGG